MARPVNAVKCQEKRIAARVAGATGSCMSASLRTGLFLSVLLALGCGVERRELDEGGAALSGGVERSATDVVSMAASTRGVVVRERSGDVRLYDSSLETSVLLAKGAFSAVGMNEEGTAFWAADLYDQHNPARQLRSRSVAGVEVEAEPWVGGANGEVMTHVKATRDIVAYIKRLDSSSTLPPSYSVCSVRASDLEAINCVGTYGTRVEPWQQFVLLADIGGVSFYRHDATSLGSQPTLRDLPSVPEYGIQALSVVGDRLWLSHRRHDPLDERDEHFVRAYDLASLGDHINTTAVGSVMVSHRPERLVATASAAYYRFGETSAGARDGGIGRVTTEGRETTIVAGLGAVDDLAIVGDRLYFVEQGKVTFKAVEP